MVASILGKSENKSISCSVVSDSLQPHGLLPGRPLCPWNSPGKDTGVGCHSLLQKIFPTPGSNPSFLHYRKILHCLSRQGSPLLRKTGDKRQKEFVLSLKGLLDLSGFVCA